MLSSLSRGPPWKREHFLQSACNQQQLAPPSGLPLPFRPRRRRSAEGVPFVRLYSPGAGKQKGRPFSETAPCPSTSPPARAALRRPTGSGVADRLQLGQER